MAYYANWDIYDEMFCMSIVPHLPRTTDGICEIADLWISVHNPDPSNLPTEWLTHIFYAFANVGTDGTVTSSDTGADLQNTFDGDNPDEAVSEWSQISLNSRILKVVLCYTGEQCLWQRQATLPRQAAEPQPQSITLHRGRRWVCQLPSLYKRSRWPRHIHLHRCPAYSRLGAGWTRH